MKESDGIMLFHDCSSQIYWWLKKQRHVKEESLTDWLLYQVSEKCPDIYYQAFTKHEEVENGCDWEWWILTSDMYSEEYCAYRFLVQAKKLYLYTRDNYPLLSYSNKNGMQIDLLINEAKYKDALPLYMFYSTGESDINEQMKNNPWLSEETFRWCEDCENGCYISLASAVYELLFGGSRRKILDGDLLNCSFKLSLCDLLFVRDAERLLNKMNQILIQKEQNRNRLPGVIGIKHYKKGIPDYLKMFVERREEDLSWFEREMRLTDIGGIGVIDLRRKE